MEDESEAYATLPAHVQRKIDNAFYSALGYTPGKRKRRSKRLTSTGRATKKQMVASGGGFLVEAERNNLEFGNGAGGGGFIADDAPETSTGGGGFIVEEDVGQPIRDDEGNSIHEGKPEYIPLSTIPDALQLLDLSPDDAQVMGVFRRAAADWDEVQVDGATPTNGEPGEGLVSLKDWRAVCGVLLEGADIPEDSETLDVEEPDDEDPNPSDDYAGDSEEESDEYVEDQEISHRRVRRTRGTTNKSSRQTDDSDLSSLSGDDSPSRKPLTSRQHQTCLQAFALFFPNVGPEDLPKQRLHISDIQRVAGLLKEKLKAEEMVEMVETFSTSPDKSMSLADFERMMIRAKLA
ncbi:hypothetical protein V5O48_007327 [Marasmius crinis-equi]|uniref:EF-hand domain-containing protein n=1 Tax=Marasmius crinis-equi TaxID=585013 RepID=A0ABR3FH87_9AGAR